METLMKMSCWSSTKRFLNFLRGMETIDGDRGLLALVDFLNFLRGMETQTPPHGATPPKGFLNFLRGMETAVVRKPRTTRTCLPKLP